MVRRNRFPHLLVVLALLWSLTPIYWFLSHGVPDAARNRRFPPSSPCANLAAFYMFFGFNYTLPTGTVSPASARPDRLSAGS